ncbi:MAG: hypothetical protein WCX73_05720 [Candidatus Pacearchaeota archaeon]|jgi:hypothetical protein
MTKTQFAKKLRAYVYWNTKKDSDENNLQELISKWLKKNPEGFEIYMMCPDYWFNSLKGAVQGRKEDLLLNTTK